MRARDKFIVVALIALFVVVSGAAIAIDRAETKTIVPAFGGTYVEGVTSAAQYLNPVLAATPVDDDVVRLVFSGLTRFRSARLDFCFGMLKTSGVRCRVSAVHGELPDT